MDVFSTSNPEMVGVALGALPQALITIAMINKMKNIRFRFIFYLPLAVGVTTAESNNILVSHNDFPCPLSDLKNTVHFEALFAIHKSGGAIATHRTGETVAINV